MVEGSVKRSLKVLVVGINYAPEITGIGKYTSEMCEWLVLRGHKVRVITAPPYYPHWSVNSPYSASRYQREMLNGVSVTRCPLYVPQKPGTVTRILHLLSFALSSLPILLSQVRWKPDVVVNPVPALFSSPGAALTARLADAACVVHVQDYEVEAMLGLNMSGSAVSGLARWFERTVLRRFDRVSTISMSMMKKAKAKGISPERLLYFPNWSDTAHFRGATESKKLLRSLGVPETGKLVLYSGNMGDKQGLEIVIDVAKRLAEKNYFFLLVGEGAGRKKLELLAQDHKLSNVAFAPLQPWDAVPALLASADCHLVVQKKGVADAVLPSKLTNILAVGGNAVITAERETELGILCERHPNIAVLAEPENVEELEKGVIACCAMVKPNLIASKYARKNIDKQSVLMAFESELIGLADTALERAVR